MGATQSGGTTCRLGGELMETPWFRAVVSGLIVCACRPTDKPATTVDGGAGSAGVDAGPRSDAGIIQLAAGSYHNCALLSSGRVRCWGRGEYGALGYGNPFNVGDNEQPWTAGDIDVGGDAGIVQIAAGDAHSCVLFATGRVKCWGLNYYGQLGYGHTNNIGDDAGEYPSTAGDISVDPDASVLQVAGGETHTCALLSTGRVRCWGMGEGGRLGYGNINYVGDNEIPSAAGDVDVGGDAGVIQIVAGGSHTCALLASGKARCWGVADYYGILGYGNTLTVGYPDPPSAAGDVPVE